MIVKVICNHAKQCDSKNSPCPHFKPHEVTEEYGLSCSGPEHCREVEREVQCVPVIATEVIRAALFNAQSAQS